MRLLKSPHTIVYNCGWAVSSIYSIQLVASTKVILRLFNDYYGGIYILITLILVLLGKIILVSIPYWLYMFVSIFSCFRTYVAIPPLEFPGRLDSIS
jgi:hypothetical protein